MTTAGYKKWLRKQIAALQNGDDVESDAHYAALILDESRRKAIKASCLEAAKLCEHSEQLYPAHKAVDLLLECVCLIDRPKPRCSLDRGPSSRANEYIASKGLRLV